MSQQSNTHQLVASVSWMTLLSSEVFSSLLPPSSFSLPLAFSSPSSVIQPSLVSSLVGQEGLQLQFHFLYLLQHTRINSLDERRPDYYKKTMLPESHFNLTIMHQKGQIEYNGYVRLSACAMTCIRMLVPLSRFECVSGLSLK